MGEKFDFEIGDKVRLTGFAWSEEYFDLDAPQVIVGETEDGLPEILDNDGDRWYVNCSAGWEGELWIDEPDSVNHPSHYTAYKGVEVIQLTEQMNFCRGNAVKYIARAGLKDADKEIEDLRKAIWYIEREIQRMESE